MCVFKLVFSEKAELHTLQEYCFYIVCIQACVVRLELSENDDSHTWQENDFFLACAFSDLNYVKMLIQISEQNNDTCHCGFACLLRNWYLINFLIYRLRKNSLSEKKGNIIIDKPLQWYFHTNIKWKESLCIKSFWIMLKNKLPLFYSYQTIYNQTKANVLN